MVKTKKRTATEITCVITENQLSDLLIHLIPIEIATPYRKKIIISSPMKDEFGTKFDNCATHIISANVLFRGKSTYVEKIVIEPTKGDKYYCVLRLNS